MNKTQLLQYLKRRGFSKEILYAFSEVKRENFVPSKLEKHAYEDVALPIGEGQTISQPYTIGVMLSLLELKSTQKVLEIGSGCGYVLALISKITKEKVFGIEIIKELAEKSKENLKGYNNIKIYHGSGALGLEEKDAISVEVQKGSRPSVFRGESTRETRGSLVFDRIIISAACKEIPKKLLPQLKNNGIIVAPIGPRYEQSLIAFRKIKNKLTIKKEVPGFVFVPFVKD